MIIEHLARIAQTAEMDACLFEVVVSARQAARQLFDFVFFVLACNSADQIEHVELNCGMTQKMSEVPESFRVLQTEGFSAVTDGLVPALFAEDSLFAQNGYSAPGHCYQPSRSGLFAPQVPSEIPQAIRA